MGLGKLSMLFKASFTGKYALLTNTLSGALLFILGDSLQQKLEIHNGLHESIDTSRIGRIGIIGLVEAPPHFYFYKYLDKLFPGKSIKIIFTKILIDQLACPFFSFQFFVGMALLEGKSWKSSLQEFKVKFPTVYLVDWCLWPPCQWINFSLVPTRYRVLYVNTVTVGWNVFLSYFKHFDQFSGPKIK